MDGWIKISRKICEHWIWSDERKLKWWLDLLILAAWDDTYVEIGKRSIPCPRGAIVTTMTELAERWNTDKHSVSRFLSKLQSFGMVELDETTTRCQRIFISKYIEYQEMEDTTSPKVEEKPKETIVTPSPACSIEKRKEKFYQSLVPFVEKYGREMIRDFFDYWAEFNKSKTKMRWELERTWETGRRLAYWGSRNNKFNENGTNRQTNSSAEKRAESVADIIGHLKRTNN